jgi:hypothetical protein
MTFKNDPFNDPERQKYWAEKSASLNAATASLPPPPDIFNTAPKTETVRVPQTSRLTQVVQPADTTSTYKQSQANQSTYLNEKATYAYDKVDPVFNDNYTTPATLPQNTTQFNSLADKSLGESNSSDPFKTYNTAQTQKTLGCLAQNFLPTLPSLPSLPSFDSVFGFSPFDQGIKSKSVLQKTGGFTGFDVGGFILNTAKSYLNDLLAPVSGILKTVSNCFKQD